MLIFGSTAIKYHFPDFYREVKDLDYISRDRSNLVGVEHHWVDAFDYILENNQDKKYVDPNFLYTIKCSHIAWPINFNKHIKDIVFLKNKGCVLDKKLYNELVKAWGTIHKEKTIKLRKKSLFFKDNVKREFDHDFLHLVFAFEEEKPIYKKIITDPEDTFCHKDLWEKLTEEEKLKCALEETFVVAYERFKHLPPNIAKYKAMEKLITTMTKGWFNLFIVENFEKMMKFSNNKYIDGRNYLNNIGGNYGKRRSC